MCVNRLVVNNNNSNNGKRSSPRKVIVEKISGDFPNANCWICVRWVNKNDNINQKGVFHWLECREGHWCSRRCVLVIVNLLRCLFRLWFQVSCVRVETHAVWFLLFWQSRALVRLIPCSQHNLIVFRHIKRGAATLCRRHCTLGMFSLRVPLSSSQFSTFSISRWIRDLFIHINLILRFSHFAFIDSNSGATVSEYTHSNSLWFLNEIPSFGACGLYGKQTSEWVVRTQTKGAKMRQIAVNTLRELETFSWTYEWKFYAPCVCVCVGAAFSFKRRLSFPFFQRNLHKTNEHSVWLVRSVVLIIWAFDNFQLERWQENKIIMQWHPPEILMRF